MLTGSGRGFWPRPPVLADELPLVRYVVDQDVLAQSIWSGYEHPAAVDPHEVVDELHHIR